jgi:hypothetical protein
MPAMIEMRIDEPMATYSSDAKHAVNESSRPAR